MAALTGMKAITQYMGRSEATILALIRHHNFPAKKILGVWESHSDLVEHWRLQQLGAATPDESQPQENPTLVSQA